MTSNGRRGFTLIEAIVFLAILSVLLGLLLPAIQASRERVRETVCKNNLHQINIAIGHYSQAMGHAPRCAPPGLIGGWMVDLLPYLEQTNLYNSIRPRTRIADAPQLLLRQPTVFSCPACEPSKANTMDVAHYVLAVNGKEASAVFDSPLDLKAPWANGPEMPYDKIIHSTGPHHGGFFYASLYQQGVDFMLNGRDVH